MERILFAETSIGPAIQPWQHLGERDRVERVGDALAFLFQGTLVLTHGGRVVLVCGWGQEAFVEGWEWMSVNDQLRTLDRNMQQIIEVWLALCAKNCQPAIDAANAGLGRVRVRRLAE